MSNILDIIIEEDQQLLLEYVENLKLWKDFEQTSEMLNNFVETGNMNLIYDYLGEQIMASISGSKSTRQRKQALQATDNRENILAQVKIKSEKISSVGTADSTAEDVKVKIEKLETEDMPAPKLPPRKRKVMQQPTVDLPKRSTRTRNKPDYTESNNKIPDGETPDVILQDAPIPVIDLNVTDVSRQSEMQTTRSTRTKTRKHNENNTAANPTEQIKSDVSKPPKKETKNKRDRSKEDENPEVQLKKSRSNSNSSTEANKTGQTEYEDAVSTVESNETQNQRHEAPQAADVNSTFIVTKKNDDNKKNIDEAENDEVSVQKQPSKVAKTAMNTPTKATVGKKIEPSEKVQSLSKIPTKSKLSEGVGGNSKTQTPLSTKFKPMTCSTSKATKIYSNKKATTPNGSALSNSALKVSQAEYREREKRRLEKEQEALKKKEALLQAAAEEKRKKREEKQMKAQLQREEIRKEKQKLLEMQEKKLKKDLEQMKEQKKKQKIAEMQSKGLPLYMVTKAPLLPTDDCYDTDDDSGQSPKCAPAGWTGEKRLVQALQVMDVIGESIKNTLFCRKIHSPDLQEIFELIDPKKLKRTSSAVWRKPPRYTMFQTTRIIDDGDDLDNED